LSAKERPWPGVFLRVPQDAPGRRIAAEDSSSLPCSIAADRHIFDGTGLEKQDWISSRTQARAQAVWWPGRIKKGQ